ncbi:hypothetical protein ACFQ0D_18280, partial [Micromonospora zhanjiangensis]
MTSAATVSVGGGAERVPDTAGPAPEDLLRRLRNRGPVDPVTHVERLPASPGVAVPSPSRAGTGLVRAGRGLHRGVDR